MTRIFIYTFVEGMRDAECIAEACRLLNLRVTLDAAQPDPRCLLATAHGTAFALEGELIEIALAPIRPNFDTRTGQPIPVN